MLIAREKELSWLERQSKLAPLLLLTGVRGVGKTQLLRAWLQKQPKKFYWITAESLKDLPALLGHKQLSLEASLEASRSSWQNYELMVWDELHLLAPGSRQALFSFLKSSPYLPTQIFLSDEELPETKNLDIAQMRLQPFSLEDVGRYLQELGEDPSQATYLHKQSGGIPLLLRIWGQSKNLGAAFQENFLAELSAPQKEMLAYIAVWNRPHAANAKDITVCEELRRKCFLEKNHDESYQIPQYVRNLLLQLLPKNELQQISKRICLQLSEPGILFFFHALQTQEENFLEKSLDKKLLENLEHLHRDDLAELSGAMEKIVTPPKKAFFLFQRLRLRALFLLGNRQEALRVGETLAESVSPLEADFLLEFIQILNRSGQSEKARHWSGQAGSHISLRIEQAVSWMPGEPQKAEEILSSVLKENFSEQNLVFAQANFQMARAQDLQNRTERAEEYYGKALKAFLQADKPYFAAVTQLNLAWIALNTRSWEKLSKIKEELTPLASRYGYQYVLAGLELLEAIEARLFLQLGKALQKIESSQKRLGTSAPSLAVFDAESEYIKILHALGLQEQVEQHLRSLKQKKTPGLEQRWNNLELELQMKNLGSDNWLDRWEKNKNQDLLDIFSLQRGLELVSNPKPKYPLLALALAEASLTHAIQNQEDPWPYIARMEKILEQSPDPMPEKAATLLLQAALSKEEKERFLLKAERELQRMGLYQTDRSPLYAWFISLKEGKSTLQNPVWEKSSPGEKERWRRWLYNEQKHTAPWLLVSDSGKKELFELEHKENQADLFLIEHLAEVFWKGKKLEELLRRHSLRSLLCLLLEQNPEAVTKQTITAVVWGESYNPHIHDARIYTSVQRLRALLSGDKEEAIQSWKNGYRWNPKFSFQLFRKQQKLKQENRYQNLILQALESFSQKGQSWVSRGELVEITKSSEATIKRELAKLLGQGKIKRQGKGRAVVYSQK